MAVGSQTAAHWGGRLYFAFPLMNNSAFTTKTRALCCQFIISPRQRAVWGAHNFCVSWGTPAPEPHQACRLFSFPGNFSLTPEALTHHTHFFPRHLTVRRLTPLQEVVGVTPPKWAGYLSIWIRVARRRLMRCFPLLCRFQAPEVLSPAVLPIRVLP